MDKIRICIDHINEVFDTEDLATEVDFGTLHVVADRVECDLPHQLDYVDAVYRSAPLTSDDFYRLYQI